MRVDLNFWCDLMSLPVTTESRLSECGNTGFEDRRENLIIQQALSGRKSPGVGVPWDRHSLCFPLIFHVSFAYVRILYMRGSGSCLAPYIISGRLRPSLKAGRAPPRSLSVPALFPPPGLTPLSLH